MVGLFSLCTNGGGVVLGIANCSGVNGVVIFASCFWHPSKGVRDCKMEQANKWMASGQVDGLIGMHLPMSDGWSMHVVNSNVPRDFKEIANME